MGLWAGRAGRFLTSGARLAHRVATARHPSACSGRTIEVAPRGRADHGGGAAGAGRLWATSLSRKQIGTMATLPRSNISHGKIPSAIQKLNRRLTELRTASTPHPGEDINHAGTLIANKINATLDEVFGQGTADARDFWIEAAWFRVMSMDGEEKVQGFVLGRERTIKCVADAIQRLEERLADGEEDTSARALRAYEGLVLHSEIARAATDLYRDGHYANAVEASVKALNGLVRLRSDLELEQIQVDFTHSLHA